MAKTDKISKLKYKIIDLMFHFDGLFNHLSYVCEYYKMVRVKRAKVNVKLEIKG